MTTTPDHAGELVPLPGLTLDSLRTIQTPIEREAVAQLEALNRAGVLNEGHRLVVALILDLCRTIGIGAATGRAAGTAMAARQLLDAMDKLPPLVPEHDPHDDWADVVRALSGS